jgi:hypothetical protein
LIERRPIPMLSFVVEAKNAREKNVSNGGRKYLVISK